MDKLLSVDGLKTHFFLKRGVVKAVDGVSFALAAGETLEARSICAFIAIFWGARLVVQIFFFDASEFLTNWFLKAGYHVLTLTFVYQTVAYGYCAFF